MCIYTQMYRYTVQQKVRSHKLYLETCELKKSLDVELTRKPIFYYIRNINILDFVINC